MTARRTMTGVINKRYEERLRLGELDADAAQAAAVIELDALAHRLNKFKRSRPRFGGLFSRPQSPPKGLYIHGAVGRGKTMLMDLFFEEAAIAPKRRVHFHEFMSSVHDRIRDARSTDVGDPIPTVAAGFAAEARLLCFDELHVTDIADAMILGRLFEALMANGAIVVATSNSAPRELYKDGLNRQLFLPFISLIESHMDILELKSAKDFRLDKIAGVPLYFSPIDRTAKAELDRHWDRLTGRHPGSPMTLAVKGRQVSVPMASMGVARFEFDDLCDRPLGPADYLSIAHSFHTVLIDGIPVIDRSRRDVARRFITLIDTLYDNGVCLIASAEAEPERLYPSGDGAGLFHRTASRLIEMRSEAYISARRGTGGQAESPALGG